MRTLLPMHSRDEMSGSPPAACEGGLSSQTPLSSLCESVLAASHHQGSQGARPHSASWPLRAHGDCGLGPEPTEGRGPCGGESRAATRECRSEVRNFLSFIGNRRLAEPGAGTRLQRSRASLAASPTALTLARRTPAGTTKLSL